MKRIFWLSITWCISIFCYAQPNKAWISRKDALFTATSSAHINLFVFNNYLDPRTAAFVLADRENSFGKITRYLGIRAKTNVNIFLFPDEPTKYRITGHKGVGWAFDNNIVEVMNDSTRADPYHEMVHIIVYTISAPPALIDEGLAVYLSEKFGSNAFAKLVGQPGHSVDDILRTLIKKGTFIPIATLVGYTDIGQAANVPLAYCESASFVKFLVNRYGKNRFLRLLKAANRDGAINNIAAFKKIYSAGIKDMQKKWLQHLLKI